MVFVFAGIFCLIPAKKVVSVSNRKNPSQRFYSAEAYRYGFIISYTHSVNKGRVHDFYKCANDGELVLEKTHFVSYGAGIPEPEETPGAEFELIDNCYIISNLNRKIPSLVMAVGIIANHSFASADLFDSAKKTGSNNTESDYKNIPGELFLTDYFEPQTSLILKIKNVNLIDYLIHKVRRSKWTN